MDSYRENLNREVPKLPAPPFMTSSLISALTELCFVKDKITKVDLIFVFGSNVMHENIAGLVCKLLSRKICDTVLITGGIANYIGAEYDVKPESERILSLIPLEKFPKINFYQEVNSKNTLENVTEAQRIFNFSTIQSILYISHAYGSKRSGLTLTRFFGNCVFVSLPLDINSGEKRYPVSISTWYKTEYGQSLVWGEFLRFIKYGERGDFPIERVAVQLDNVKKICYEQMINFNY